MFNASTLMLGSGLISLASSTIVPAHTMGNATWPYQTYKTVDFMPPLLTATHHSPPNHDEGYLFIAPDGSKAFRKAPMILGVDGDLIWNGPNNSHAFAFGVYTYLDQEVLAYWNGTLFPEPVGRGNGVIHVLNKQYEDIATVSLPGNFLELEPGTTYESNVDVHEIFFTENGTMLVTANNVTNADLTSVGGPKEGWIVDCLIYEIDIASKEVLFEWSSLAHQDAIPISDSVYPLGSDGFDGLKQENAWGYFHINAVSPFDGGYVMSSRFLCAAIHISATGDVEWILQGRDGGDFDLLGQGARFCYQHDIRADPMQPAPGQTEIKLRMHDNANSPIENMTIPTSGKVLNLDLEKMTASLEQEYRNPGDVIYSTAQGNMQILPNGNVFVGHGWIPVAEEFDAFGKILSTFQFGAPKELEHEPSLSYRDFKHRWTGCPAISDLAVVTEPCDEGHVAVYVSWNGATEVQGWEIYAGESEDCLQRVRTVSKEGFETAVEIEHASYVQVRPVFQERHHHRGGWFSQYWRKEASEHTQACQYDGRSASRIVKVDQ